MRSTRCAVVIAFGLTLTCIGVGWAQFTPEIGTSASMLGRGNVGVALTNEFATGMMNPAALPMLYRAPGAAKLSKFAHAGVRDAGRYAAAADDGSQAPRHLSLYGGAGPDAFALGSLGFPALSAVPQALLGPVGRTLQVAVESRFLHLDQRFLEEVGVQWPGLGATQIGFTTDIDSEWDLNSFQGTYGTIGGGDGWALGYLEDFDSKFLYAAYGRKMARVISAPRATTMNRQSGTLSVGAKISHNDLVDGSKTTADVGLLLDVTPAITSENTIIMTVGLVGRDVFDGYGEFEDAGRRFDLGLGLTGRKFRVGLDVVDIGDNTAIPGWDESGRQINIGGEFEVINNVVLMGGLRDGEEAFGVRAQIPILSKIPFISFAFSKSHEHKQAELLLFITPQIIDGAE